MSCAAFMPAFVHRNSIISVKPSQMERLGGLLANLTKSTRSLNYSKMPKLSNPSLQPLRKAGTSTARHRSAFLDAPGGTLAAWPPSPPLGESAGQEPGRRPPGIPVRVPNLLQRVHLGLGRHP